MFLLIFYLFLALFVSFLCSVMEAVLLSTPITFLSVKAEEGKKAAHVFIALKKDIDRPLSAILSLNTVAHTIGAAGVGAQALVIFGEASFGIVSAVLTVLILVFSEIIPKTIGAKYWRTLALVSGRIIQGMILVTWPLVRMSQVITKLIAGKRKEKSISREEISAMAYIGADEGIIGQKENRIIQNIFKLRDVKVSEIMTPRVVVTSANQEMGLDEFLKNKDFLHFSRIPVYSNRPDNISGYVIRQTIFEILAEGPTDLAIKDLRREIVVLHESNPLLDTWDTLLQKKEHIALVVDEYGGMEGIVTLEDIIETILGLEIIDERDKVVDMQEYARQRWKERQSKYRYLK